MGRAYILIEVDTERDKRPAGPYPPEVWTWSQVANDLGCGWDTHTRIKLVKAWNLDTGKVVLATPIEVEPFERKK